MKPMPWLRTSLIPLLLVLALAGCSTTQRGGMATSMDQALSDHVELGLRYLGNGQRDAAREHLNRALEIDDRSARAHNGKALLFQTEDELDLAEEHYRKALRYDEEFTRARYNYGVFLFSMGRYDEAREHFRIAASDTDYDRRPRAFLNLGLAALRLEREDEAIEAFRRATTLEPSFARPYLELADLYFGQGRYREARRMLRAFDRLSESTARSLWLAVRVADHFDDEDTLASKGLALEKLFPDSRENLEYQEWVKNDAGS